MSSEERDMILQMVAENKISTAEAADLLDALNEVELEAAAEGDDSDPGLMRTRLREQRRVERDMRRQERDLEREARRRENDARRHRYVGGRSLLIHVRDGDETRTNVHVPLGMALAATKFIPKKARVYFEEFGIDLTELLDTVTHDLGRVGEIVNVKDGERSVQVAIVGDATEISGRTRFEYWGSQAAVPPTPPAPPAPAAPSDSAQSPNAPTS